MTLWLKLALWEFRISSGVVLAKVVLGKNKAMRRIREQRIFSTFKLYFMIILKSMRKKFSNESGLIELVTLLVFVVVVILWAFYLRKLASPEVLFIDTPVVSSKVSDYVTLAEASSWGEYKDGNLSFNFKYPLDWQVRVLGLSAKKDELQVYSPSQINTRINLVVEGKNGEQIEQEVMDVGGVYQGEARYGEMEGKLYKLEKNGVLRVDFVASNKGKAFWVYLETPNLWEASNLPVFKKIISSIKEK